MKKNIKYTRLQELETEKKAYVDETIRLKHMLDQTLKQKMQTMIQESEFSNLEDQYYRQCEQVSQLRKDNEELALELKRVEDQNFHLNNQLSEIEKKYNRDINGLRT